MQSTVSKINPLILHNLFFANNLTSMRWENFREGIDICRLHSDPGGSSTALLRYRPGAQLDRHVHTGYEHILVLSGSQSDDSGEHPAGTLLIHSPGSSHAINSPNGCIVLAIWEKAVHFPNENESKPREASAK